jgi:hypothetical protein
VRNVGNKGFQGSVWNPEPFHDNGGYGNADKEGSLAQIEEGAYSYYAPYHWNNQPHSDVTKWNPADGLGEKAATKAPAELAKPKSFIQTNDEEDGPITGSS